MSSLSFRKVRLVLEFFESPVSIEYDYGGRSTYNGARTTRWSRVQAPILTGDHGVITVILAVVCYLERAGE
jgi:hypothetical protein